MLITLDLCTPRRKRGSGRSRGAAYRNGRPAFLFTIRATGRAHIVHVESLDSHGETIAVHRCIAATRARADRLVIDILDTAIARAGHRAVFRRHSGRRMPPPRRRA